MESSNGKLSQISKSFVKFSTKSRNDFNTNPDVVRLPDVNKSNFLDTEMDVIDTNNESIFDFDNKAKLQNPIKKRKMKSILG